MSQESITQTISDQQLADLSELVGTGPVDLGAYTQAELAVVLGEVPALTVSEDAVLAEAVRSLAARGLLFREPQGDVVSIVGDLGLIRALVDMRIATLEIRRGHEGPSDEPWRWGISLLPRRVAAVDRVDALGVHRLALVSTEGLVDLIVERLIDGRADLPRDGTVPVPLSDEEVRTAASQATTSWQLIHRLPRADGTNLVIDALVLRTGDTRVDLVTPAHDDPGYQRVAVDAAALGEFLAGLAALR